MATKCNGIFSEKMDVKIIGNYWTTSKFLPTFWAKALQKISLNDDVFNPHVPQCLPPVLSVE